jgi:hypothetical protein
MCKPTPYGDARRLVEISRRLDTLADEMTALEREEQEICQRLHAAAPGWHGLIEPYGESGKYMLTLYADDHDVPQCEVAELAAAWQLPNDYPDPGPPPSIDPPSEPVDDDEGWDEGTRVGLTKAGWMTAIPAEASTAIDEADGRQAVS